MRDKIKFIKELAESMNANKIDTVKYEENDFEIQITKEKCFLMEEFLQL